MKKILDGFFYRLIKSIEFWGMIILIIVISFFMTRTNVINSSLYFYTGDSSYVKIGDITFTPEQISDMTFRNSGLTAREAFTDFGEEKGLDEYNRLIIVDEVYTVMHTMLASFIAPSLILCIFITVFFGRLFSDGTIRNIVSCGHKKIYVYLSSILLTLILSVITFFLGSLSGGAACLSIGWFPPFYIGALLPYMTVNFLAMISYTSAVLAILFLFKSRTVSIIAGFALILGILFLCPIVINWLSVSEREMDTSSSEFMEFRDITKETGEYDLRFDPIRFEYHFFTGEKEYDFFTGEEIPYALKGIPRYLMIGLTYMNPSTPYSFILSQVIECNDLMDYHVLEYNCLGQAALITVTDLAALLLFKRKELN